MAPTDSTPFWRNLPVLILGAFALLMVGTGLSHVLAQRRVSQAFELVTHTKDVQLAIVGIRSTVHRARANVRTFLLTGRTDVLVTYRQAQAVMPGLLDRLSELVKDQPQQAERASLVRATVTEALAVYESELAGSRVPGNALQPWQRVAAATDAMDREAERLLAAQQAQWNESVALTYTATAVNVVIGLGLLVAIALLTRRLAEAKARAEVADAEAERAAAQAALSEREAEFRTLADNISQFAWMAEKDGTVYWYNRRFLEFVGGPVDRALGWGWTELFEPELCARVMQGYKAALASQTNWEDTFPLRSASGQTRWFLARAVPVRNAEGQVLRWLGTHTDITELRDTQSKLLEASRRKDEFLATLSHELRNPLAPILNAAQLMSSTGVSTTQLQWCGSVIQRQSQHLARLVDDLLDASRVSRGRLELRREPVDLRSVIHTAVEAVRPAFVERRHELDVQLQGPAPILDADPVRLAQVVTNLLSNACKYTDPGGRVSLRTGVRGNWAVITVKDSGIGLDAADLDNVFDMFAQVRSALSRSSGGLGIGLALAKGIVELHGGTIRAASAGLGFGTEFIVELPLPAVRTWAPEEAAPVPLVAAGDRTAGRRVLLADDNRDAADSMASMLRLLGHDVKTAYDGLEALAAAEEFAPEVAVLDIGMPGLNGYEVARRLRKNPARAGVVLIALTGWGQIEDRKQAMEAGFDQHITKPADPEKLLQFIASVGAPS